MEYAQNYTGEPTPAHGPSPTASGPCACGRCVACRSRVTVPVRQATPRSGRTPRVASGATPRMTAVRGPAVNIKVPLSEADLATAFVLAEVLARACGLCDEK